MTLGEKIQDLRRKSGMSQDDLAEKLDISRQAVSKWERDEAVPETDKIIRIAQEFHVSTDYLLLDQQAPPASGTPREPSAGQQILRGVRRHGYKSGYAMIVAGTVLCIIALLIMLFLPGMGSGAFGMAGSFTDSVNSMYQNSGFGSSGTFTDITSSFNQQVDQMESMWTGGTTLIAMIIAIPMFLGGAALIIGGIIIIIKGKKIAVSVK